ncbi:MAG: hypothetical protein ABI334_09070 [Candidatus Dormiibacterota bacterium]
MTRGQQRYSRGGAPTWVIELTAPADSSWKSYSAQDLVDAIRGAVSCASVLAGTGT